MGDLHIPDLDVVSAVNANAHSALSARVGRRASIKISLNPAADVVPVSELRELRDALYENDQLTMQGLAKINRVIENCGKRKVVGIYD